MPSEESKTVIPLPDLSSTDAFAKNLVEVLTPGLVIHLYGELGSGKTTLVRAILRALGYTGVAKSPTYTLVETYQVGGFNINHFDLYRIADPSELEFIGIRDYVDGAAVCIFEWPQRGAGLVPQADLSITMQLQDDTRTATVETNPAGTQ